MSVALDIIPLGSDMRSNLALQEKKLNKTNLQNKPFLAYLFHEVIFGGILITSLLEGFKK